VHTGSLRCKGQNSSSELPKALQLAEAHWILHLKLRHQECSLTPHWYL